MNKHIDTSSVQDGPRQIDVSGIESYWNEQFGLLNRFIMISYRWNVRPLIWCIKILFHVQLPTGNSLLLPIRMAHPFGIFVSAGTRVGRNCTLFHGVTLGHKRFGLNQGAPILGDDAIIFPNAIVIGSINIGDRAVIGAGAVVVKDVPSDYIVAGNPARVIGVANDSGQYHEN